MRDFVYERPETVEDACRMLARDGARPLAGGTDLIAQMREGRRHAGFVVDIKGIDGLGTVVPMANGGVRIGAATSATRTAASALVKERYAGLADALGMIGSLQIQNRATLVGNVCNASPSADAPPVLLCLGARLDIAGRSGLREAEIADIYDVPGRTRLAPGEWVTAVRLPALVARTATAYVRFTPRRELDIAVAGAAALVTLDAQGHFTDVRIALASVAPTPIRAPTAEARLLAARPDIKLLAEAGRLASRDCAPISDTRGSAEYRRELVAVLTGRALARCCERLGVGVNAP